MTASLIAFYATAATVIPVLYLAIAVQGRTYETMVNNSIRAAATARIAQHSRPLGKRMLAEIRSIGSGIAPWLVLLYGTLGEIGAIVALQSQADVNAIQTFVAGAVILLTLVAAAGPAQIGARAILTIRRQQTPNDIWRAEHSRRLRKLGSGKSLTPGYAHPRVKRLSRLLSRIRAREPDRVPATRGPEAGGNEQAP
jgi:hypothetical protein